MKKGYKTGLLAVAAVMALGVLAPEFAHAQGNVNTLLTGDTVKPIIKFGIGLYAAWKWFQYFANFNPNSAFTDIIVPAIMTFLALKYDVVLGWFGFQTM